jgi:hypothetical protein
VCLGDDQGMLFTVTELRPSWFSTEGVELGWIGKPDKFLLTLGDVLEARGVPSRFIEERVDSHCNWVVICDTCPVRLMEGLPRALTCFPLHQ